MCCYQHVLVNKDIQKRKYVRYYNERAAATGNMRRKFDEIRTWNSRNMLADRQTDRHTHTHYNTPHPYRGGIIKNEKNLIRSGYSTGFILRSEKPEH